MGNLTVEDLMTNIVVKQDEQKPMPVEVLADSIKAIADGIRKLRAGPLSNFALLLLGLRECRVSARLKAGWSIEQAVTEPSKTGRGKGAW